MVEGAGDVPGAASDTRRGWSGWAAHAATTWAFAFAVVHLYWALGGTVGLPKGMSVDMNPALFVIDVLAVPLCVAGALLALSLVRPWGRRIPRRLLLADAWAVCALLVVQPSPRLSRAGWSSPISATPNRPCSSGGASSSTSLGSLWEGSCTARRPGATFGDCRDRSRPVQTTVPYAGERARR